MFVNMSWKNTAKRIEKNADIEVDWEERQFICPMCQKLILEKDFYYIPAECENESSEAFPYCPICGFFFED